MPHMDGEEWERCHGCGKMTPESQMYGDGPDRRCDDCHDAAVNPNRTAPRVDPKIGPEHGKASPEN